jgi:DNA-binding NarL/FixJ family response regulator
MAESAAPTADGPAGRRAEGTGQRPITVVIADDQKMVRQGLRVILEAEPGISVVAEADDGAQAIELVRRHLPAVALLDIRMPVLDGLRAARQVLADSPGTRVLILTTFDADEYVYEALRAGASGFLLKDAPADQLVTAVRCLAAGDALVDPVITRRLISRFTLAAAGPRACPTSCASSPLGNWKSSAWWRPACPTSRSPGSSWWRRTPSRPTSAGS